MPRRLEPEKNCTGPTVPVLSEALAARVMLPPAATASALDGLVMETVGYTKTVSSAFELGAIPVKLPTTTE